MNRRLHRRRLHRRRLPRPSRPIARRRPAVVLLIVLVVIVVLSLAAYTFCDLMLTHRHATILSGKRIQARMLVDSGVEATLQYLAMDDATRTESGGHYDNPLYFQKVVVVPEMDLESRATFTIVAPMAADDGSSFGVRYGLEDESVRLNLNLVLLADSIAEGSSRELLMSLPGMTEDIADAILDWIDPDDEAREFGAEVEYYSRLEPNAYAPRNGPVETVEELLLVRGVLPELLFGIDVNRNGMADPHETSPMAGGGASGSAAASVVPDPAALASGSAGGSNFNRGWSSLLTVYSAERNLTSTGQPRIYLNGDDLQQLYDDLTTVFSQEWAKFIVAYRIYGAYDGSDAGNTGADSLELDLTQQPQTQITQVLDLIGAKVQVGGAQGGNNGQPPPTVESPFASDPVAMALYLPTLMDNCTVNQSESIPGRININQAPPELLLGIPGITEEIVTSILDARSLISEEESPNRAHETWLLAESIVTLDEMKTLMPFVTAGGDVFRAQVVGYYQGGGPSARAEVVFDATSTTPRVLFWRDLSHLGRGYALETLGVDLMSAP